MPKEIKDVRDFILASRRKDASLIKIKKNTNGETKFKVRCSKYLYTMVVKDSVKADKLAKSLPVSECRTVMDEL
ncbi:60S ribosomal protein L38 [Blastocystis sp. ATCC 50177/Nand II]|uniref:60S ribosomal protein L38 n=1 Tax=Blastocystis sp. subtype 1 (strain ATCC 50177 / NandII) TaxID=478820 RepID=A0A196SEI6_BLAHN|nr:60S ribosomal protein L38 [Blastocystis sp. ATCC 50177/Nand II]